MAVSNCQAHASNSMLSPTGDPEWLLVEDGVNPAREREIESLFAIGNGYLGMRASIAEGTRFLASFDLCRRTLCRGRYRAEARGAPGLVAHRNRGGGRAIVA